MAKFTFTVTGAGTTAVSLPVELPQGNTLIFDGIELKSLPFKVKNILGRPVTFTSVGIEITGAGAPKVHATVRLDMIEIAPSGELDNFLDVETTEMLLENETFEIVVLAQE